MLNYISDFCNSVADNQTRCRPRSSSKYQHQLPRYFTILDECSLSVSGTVPNQWTSLPNHVKNAPFLETFKSRLKAYLLKASYDFHWFIFRPMFGALFFGLGYLRRYMMKCFAHADQNKACYTFILMAKDSPPNYYYLIVPLLLTQCEIRERRLKICNIWAVIRHSSLDSYATSSIIRHMTQSSLVK